MTYSDPNFTALLATVHANPFDGVARQILADWLDEHDDAVRANYLRVRYIPAFDADLAAIEILCHIRLAHGGQEAKFICDLYAKTKFDGVNELVLTLSPRQFLWLWLLVRRYRRQIKDKAILQLAESRYETYCKLLRIDDLPPSKRGMNKRVDTRNFPFFDEAM